MAIDISCPTCEKSYNLADSQRGKTVRCKHCDDTFTVPREERGRPVSVPRRDDPPRRRDDFRGRDEDAPPGPRRRDDDEDRRPRRRSDDEERRPRRSEKGGGGNGLLVGFVVGGLLLLLMCSGGGVLFAMLLFPSRSNQAGIVPGRPDWNRVQIGWTEQQVVDVYGQPTQRLDFKDIHVIHAHVKVDEVKGPDGKTRPVRKLTYFKGFGQVGFVDITLVDGRVYKIKK